MCSSMSEKKKMGTDGEEGPVGGFVGICACAQNRLDNQHRRGEAEDLEAAKESRLGLLQ